MPDISLDILKTVLLNGGSFAILCWLVIYAVRTLFPQMQADHQKALDTQAATFKSMLDDLRADWRQEQDRHDQMLQSLVASVDKLSDKVESLTKRPS